MTIDNVQKTYQEWVQANGMPTILAEELRAIASSPDEIHDRFYRELTFGTGGLRGVLGAGTNRMNLFTIRRTTQGLAEYIRAMGGSTDGVVVGYDCRRMSREFAEEVGKVLAAAGVKAWVFEHLCPTPELSFAVRKLGAAGGVMITASHNPPEYNGYKVYDSTGCQILDDAAREILHKIDEIQDWFHTPAASLADAEQAGLFNWVGKEVDEAYYETVLTLKRASTSTTAREELKVVYSPLHGTGNIPVRTVLSRAGFNQVAIVELQERPDGEFPTVKSPNPEEHSAFRLALQLAEHVGADIALATDPDADRVGVAVRNEDGSYKLLTGNQVGGLLVQFVLADKHKSGTLPADGIVFKTIVTSELGAEVARRYGIRVEDTLTGFKYIGDLIRHYEESGDGTFLFGYEESYGYLAADFVRDKDAVQICLLICEMAAQYKAQGLSLLDALDRLYKEVGYFEEKLISTTLPGENGMAQMIAMMEEVRTNGIHVNGLSLVAMEDYQSGQRSVYSQNGNTQSTEALTLPKSNVIRFCFEGGAWFALRPSGTEPKMKFYLGAKGNTAEECRRVLESFERVGEQILRK